MKLIIRYWDQIIGQFADATFNPVDRSELNESKMNIGDYFTIPEDPRPFKVIGRFWQFTDGHPADDELVIFVEPAELNIFSQYLVKNK